MPTLPFPSHSQLAAYLRDSGGDDQDLSIDQQRQAIAAWCAANGYTLSRTFEDYARPGSTTTGRQAFHDLMHHFRTGTPPEAGVVIWRYSRFARDIDDAQFYRADLRRRGFEFYSITDPVPPGLDGRFFEAAIDWMNHKFLETLSIEARRGLHYIVATYGAVPGTPPLGFVHQPIELPPRRDGRPHTLHRWVPDPEMLPRIKLAFSLRAAGATYKTIHHQVQLYPSKNSYTTFFSNRLYTGELVFGDQVYEHYCDPIVDRSTWLACQRSPRPNSQPLIRNSPTDSPFVLSGILACARCGSPMHGHVVKSNQRRNVSRWTYYTCSRQHRRRDCDAQHIPQATIEAAVLADLRDYVLDPKRLAAIQDELRTQRRQSRATHDEQRSAIDKRLANLQRRIDNTADAIADRGKSPALLDKLTALERDQANLQADLLHLARSAQPDPFLDLAPTGLEALRQDLLHALDNPSPPHLRQLLQAWLHRVTVEREGRQLLILTEYYMPPPSPLQQTTPGPTDPGVVSYAYTRCPQWGTLYRHNFTIKI